MFQILSAVIIGCILGIITGISPGIHINLVSALVISYSFYLTKLFPNELIAVAVISMAISHTFLDIIPTTFLGVNNDDNLAYLLPSHKLLLEGKSMLVIKLSCLGCFLGLVSTILLTPLLIFLLPKIYPIIKDYIPYILIILSLIIIYQSSTPLNSFFIFLVSGILGVLTLSLKTLNQPLLPLFSGLFGLSSLVLTIKNNTKIPEQHKVKLIINKTKLSINIFLSLFSAVLTSFLPALTSAHTTKIVSWLNNKVSEEDYIVINNSINTIAMFLSIIALYTINKARNGAIIAISNIITINYSNLILLIVASIISSFIAIFLTLSISKIFSKLIVKVNYKLLCIFIICLIILITLFISSYLGIIVLFTSCGVGIIAISTNVDRINLIGCLIIPVVLYSLL